MSSTMKALGIDRMSVPERVALVQEIWNSIASEIAPTELGEVQKTELRKRAAEHHADPHDVIPWEQIKADAMKRFGK